MERERQKTSLASDRKKNKTRRWKRTNCCFRWGGQDESPETTFEQRLNEGREPVVELTGGRAGRTKNAKSVRTEELQGGL